MSQMDWITWHNEWSKSINMHDYSTDPDLLTGIPKKTTKGRIYKFYHIEMTTQKAKFFVVDLSKGKRGFWVPNAAIINETVDTVEVADWCNLNEIEFR